MKMRMEMTKQLPFRIVNSKRATARCPRVPASHFSREVVL